jgi:hypothetical protein
MTKSGIGTALSPLPLSQTTVQLLGGQQQQQHQLNTREIPIWVNDKKKWVTGISKKTTIHDIIYAILKQCNINCDYEAIVNDYVLFEILYDQQNTIINERILKGNSKVYKYLGKWLEQANKFLLKVKKCEYLSPTAPDQNLSRSATCQSESMSQNGSLSKLFKKLTVNNTIQMTNGLQATSQQQSQLVRYVDVKLPNCPPQSQPKQLKPAVGPSDKPTTTVEQLPYKQYDPTLQKSLIISNIMDKDRKLSQQFERVKLLDELVKEAEKSSQFNENAYLGMSVLIELPDPAYSVDFVNWHFSNLLRLS